MRKLTKMLALGLALAFVFGMTVSAAPSVVTNGSNTVDVTTTTPEGAIVSAKAGVNVTVDEATEDQKAAAIAAVGNAKVLAVFDVHAPEEGGVVKVALDVIDETKTYTLVHYTDWTLTQVKERVVGVVDNGRLSFWVHGGSPMILVVSDGATTVPTTGGNVSPKTGEALPVAGILAVICLAGVVVCAKKARNA